MVSPEHEDARLSWSVLLYLDDMMPTAIHRATMEETETLCSTWPKLFSMRRPTHPHLMDESTGEQKTRRLLSSARRGPRPALPPHSLPPRRQEESQSQREASRDSCSSRSTQPTTKTQYFTHHMPRGH